MKIISKLLNISLNIILLIPLLIIIITLIDNIINIAGISATLSCYNEVRDFPTLRLTEFIINGINPYTLSSLNDLNIPFHFLYSGLLPIITAVICKYTGINVISGSYIVNIVLVILTCYNIWLITKHCFENYKFIAIICIFINVASFFTQMEYIPIYTFRSDSIGIYVLSLLYLVVCKNKKLTLLSAILTVLLIFTKQFLVLISIPLFLYYFIIDKKLALKYLIELCFLVLKDLILNQNFVPFQLKPILFQLFYHYYQF